MTNEINNTKKQIEECENCGKLLLIVEELREEIKAIKRENIELKERIRILEGQISKNSQNSSKPPSSDGFKRKIYNNRERSSAPVGGQKGHKGENLNLVSNPDKVIVHKLKVCRSCGNSLEGKVIKRYERHQVYEIPTPVIEIIEHQGEVKICDSCGMENKAEFPEEAKNIVQYGINFKSQSTYLKEYQYIPYERLGEYYKEVYGHNMSEGSFKNFSEECSNNLLEYEEKVKEGIISSEVVNFDETGMKIEGKCSWVHSASTRDLTYYVVDKKRGKEGMDKGGILPSFTGKGVHDYWKSYYKYDFVHALCNAHHLRELKYIYEHEEELWGKSMIDLLMDIKEVVDVAKEVRECLEPEQIMNFEAKYDKIIEEGLRIYSDREVNNLENKEQKRGRKKQSKSKNLLDRFKSHKKEILAFMYDFKVPFDNNLAERDLRMVKLKQKISGTFRSKQGADAFLRIRGYISTAKKQGLNILQAIKDVFSGHPFIPVVNNTG